MVQNQNVIAAETLNAAPQIESTGITSELLNSTWNACREYAEGFVMSLEDEGYALVEIPYSAYMDELIETDVMSWIMGMWFHGAQQVQCRNLSDEEYSILQDTADEWTQNEVYRICGFVD